MATNRLLSDTFGVFNHFLYGDENWVKTTDSLDIKAYAARIAATGATHFGITLMQGTKYMLSPNKTYDEIAGTKPGEACAIRDVPLELGEELAKYGVDLYLYYTGDGPHKDPVIGGRFGMVEADRTATPAFVANWSAVLKEYAVRYGSLVKGWWIDGCYDFFKYNEELMAPYWDACHAGNPDCLVAMNCGVLSGQPQKRYSKDEYTSGEYNDFVVIPESGIIDGAFAHMLAPLGIAPNGDNNCSWKCPGLKRDGEYMYNYIKKLHEVGCALTIDIMVYPDGTFDPAQAEMLAKLSERLRK